jgi:hypothetical protein
MLARASQEAEKYFANITRVVGTETLRQKAARVERRFKPRVGSTALPPLQWQQREVISEFGVSAFPEAGGVLHEIRKVQQVDGRQIRKPEEARFSLATDMRNADDRLRRKLLLDFEKHGLLGAATDFTLSLLMFRPEAIDNFTFGPVSEKRLGPDEVLAVVFRQRDGAAQFTVYEGSRTSRSQLQGEVWLRKPDGVPVRVVLVAASNFNPGEAIIDEGVTDYFMAGEGYLLPAAVRHRRMRNRELILEEVSAFTRFQRFSAGVEIKFGEEVSPDAGK